MKMLIVIIEVVVLVTLAEYGQLFATPNTKTDGAASQIEQAFLGTLVSGITGVALAPLVLVRWCPLAPAMLVL